MDRINSLIFSAFQLLSRFLMVFIGRIINPAVVKPKGLKVPTGTFIISNHQHAIDPWLVCSYIDFKDLWNMLPVRYPVTPYYMRRWWIGWLIWCCGGYDIGLTALERGKKLLYTRDLIQKKYTVLLFPEGKIQDSNIGEFQRGMNMIIQENIPILLCKISGMNKADKTHPTLKYSEVIYEGSFEDKMKLIYDFFNKDGSR